MRYAIFSYNPERMSMPKAVMYQQRQSFGLQEAATTTSSICFCSMEPILFEQTIRASTSYRMLPSMEMFTSFSFYC